mgnify:CR=1 FL=1
MSSPAKAARRKSPFGPRAELAAEHDLHAGAPGRDHHVEAAAGDAGRKLDGGLLRAGRRQGVDAVDIVDHRAADMDETRRSCRGILAGTGQTAPRSRSAASARTSDRSMPASLAHMLLRQA